MYYKSKNGNQVGNRLQSDCLQVYKGIRHMASQRVNISLVDEHRKSSKQVVGNTAVEVSGINSAKMGSQVI